MNAKSFNRPLRKVYIVTGNPCLTGRQACTLVGAEDLQIMEILPEQETAFLKDYAGRIVAAGSSIQDVIMKFSESLK